MDSCDTYTCLAPWGTVVDEADNGPGGEPPHDSAEIAARCRDAGESRFETAVAVAAAAGVLALAAGTVGVARYRRDRRRPAG